MSNEAVTGSQTIVTVILACESIISGGFTMVTVLSRAHYGLIFVCKRSRVHERHQWESVTEYTRRRFVLNIILMHHVYFYSLSRCQQISTL